MGLLDTINDARQPGGLDALGRRVANNLLGQPEASQNLEDIYGYFLTNLLQSSNSVALKPLWLCFLDNVPDTTQLAQDYDLNSNAGKHKMSQGHAAAKSSIDFRGGKAALLAQEINVPGDVYRVERPDGSPNMGGFVNGVIGSQRESFGPGKIAYLETNYSFTDFVLRPWMIAASYDSLKFCAKTNITMINFAKAGKDRQFVPRKITKLHNCVPVNIDTESYTYQGNDLTIRQVEWHYDSYTMESGQFISESDILASLDRVFNFGDGVETDSIVQAAVGAATGIASNFITNLAGDAGSELEDVFGLSESTDSVLTSRTGNVNNAIERSAIAAGGRSPGNDSIATRTIEDDVVVNANDTPINIVPADPPTSPRTLRDIVDEQASKASRINTIAPDSARGDARVGVLQEKDDVIVNESDTPVIFPGDLSEGTKANTPDRITNPATVADDVNVKGDAR